MRRKAKYAVALMLVLACVTMLLAAYSESSMTPSPYVVTPSEAESHTETSDLESSSDHLLAPELPHQIESDNKTEEVAPHGPPSLDSVPLYDGKAFQEINRSVPFFEETEFVKDPFEYYSPLDDLGRCGFAYANICTELMPTEPRGQIGMIKPSGWHTVRYDDLIEDHYLYNRCHLIGYQLAGENANEQNLITGTRYMNTEGMQPFENRVAAYVQRTGNHVLYRVTPIFRGDDLVASGVLMEAYSVEDRGKGIEFCVFVFNIQPGIAIDYSTGDSERTSPEAVPEDRILDGYIGNRKSHVFHLPSCPNLPAEKNQIHFETREAAVEAGFRPCGNCHP